VQISVAVLKISRIFLDAPGTKRSGYEIAKLTKISRDTVYGTLHRLESDGWLISELERAKPTIIGRARRRLYLITSLGQTNAREALAQLQLQSVASDRHPLAAAAD
jgi:DNA-binding PadR family transcriptional regulator